MRLTLHVVLKCGPMELRTILISVELVPSPLQVLVLGDVPLLRSNYLVYMTVLRAREKFPVCKLDLQKSDHGNGITLPVF